MKRPFQLLICLSAILLAAAFTGCSSDDDNNDNPAPPTVQKPDLVFYGLTSSNTLVKYNANNSGTVISTASITGLQPAENLLAIDFRPATGQLYGLGDSSRIYIINVNTGFAIPLNAAAFAPAISGTLVGFDFNPTVDRIRLVTSSGQNLRLHPETGLAVATDTNLNPGSPNIGSAAYSNNTSGATATELFAIDFAAATLYKLESPNTGTLAAVGPLQLASAPTGDGGFDIASTNNTALANFKSGGMDHLYQIDLSSGKATDLGMLATSIIGLAIPTSPVGYAVDASNNLHIFNFLSPGTPITKVLSGFQPAETVLGIDMRPATGQLYALGSTGRIYVINTTTGISAMVGAGPVALLSGTDFGFDFNPLADRIRIVSDTGQNLRVNPNDGILVSADLTLNPGTPNITAAAYLNNYPGTATTVLYDIDSTTDMLYTQNPPNNGTLTSVGALGINIAGANGFDIGGNSNVGYAILTVGSTSKIYSINTTTGAATAIADFPATVKGFAVGVGF
ncbi:DUF4394 domain-containing protein [Flavobacterium sp.]|uniref:DUF4394 domain-containing protein n=1 Tax=Flavobacterium sp. TaxID=239 RepID=UPI0039E21A47